jgi:DNA polymerase-1
VIQGSAADMVKLAMVALARSLRQRPELHPFVVLALQLHDEIVIELPRRLAQPVAALVREAMEHVIARGSAHVPFPINLKIGESLGDMQPFNED